MDLLASIDIQPDGLIGHSVGENVCAYADGSSTREETLFLPFLAGSIFTQSDLPPGGMAAVGMSWEETKLRCPADIYPACNNAKDSVSVAGPAKSIQNFVNSLKSEGIFAKEIKTGHAFHSPHISSMKERLINILVNNGLFQKPKKRSSKWISTSIPEHLWESDQAMYSSPEYFSNNLISPVLFQEALAYIPDTAIVIEIGPHALLQAILKRSLPATCTIFGLSTVNALNNTATFVSGVGKMFTGGLNPNILKLYPQANFPVSLSASFLSPLVSWDHSETFTVADFEKVQILNCYYNCGLFLSKAIIKYFSLMLQ